MEKEISYNLETYSYSLPKELIAQHPCEKRDESRLIYYNKDRKDVSHHVFKNLHDLLNPGDVLVLNNTKVIPARFFGETSSQDSGFKGRRVEIVLVKPLSEDNLSWEVIAGRQKFLKKATQIVVQDSGDRIQDSEDIVLEIINETTIKFRSSKDLKKILNGVGKLPLPKYIERDPEEKDLSRYQTVFAKEEGAIAAPTAALHFTEDLLEKIKAKGVEVLYITLHVGPGTFMPIRTEDIREHKINPERFSVDENTWKKIKKAKEEKRKVVACGTTVVRTLEYVAKNEILSGENDLYISPGFKFQIIDSLITNFHLPATSLLLLVSAFAGWENIQTMYNEAIKEKYRFYSYGDACFID